MSSVSTTLHRTQIVVSADSDDDEAVDKSFSNGQPSSPLSYRTPTRAGTLSSISDSGNANPLSHKYPHTRTCLVGIIREHQPDVDNEGDEADGLLQQVVSSLKEENEDDLKDLLKSSLQLSDATSEQVILDLMHAHRDDLTQAPLTVLQSTKRPISRPSSRASSHSFRLNRPESPLANYGGSAPSSPKPIQLAFRRPHTPVTSPLVTSAQANATSYMSVPSSSISPTSSPPLPHAAVLSLSAGSPSSSPLSSPRFLNAKEFKPKRPLSIGSNPGTQDVWSPAAAPSSLTRTSSNLAIAPPVILTSRSATPVNGNTNGNNVSRPGSSLGPSRPPFEDEDDDEFSPFSKSKTILYKAAVVAAATQIPGGGPPSSEGTGDTSENSASSPSNSYDPPMSNDDDPYASYPYPDYPTPSFRVGPDDGTLGDEGYTEFYPGVAYRPNRAGRGDGSFHERDRDREPHDPNVPEGMTPLDVLVSVFGATMTPYELEDILAQHAWNFDDTMQFLVERGPGNVPVTGGTFAANNRGGPMDDRNATFIGRQAPGSRNITPLGHNQQNRQMSRPGRVCRYFLAGECLRSDCRFSHDLDRALCRFWLRGVCAKGDNCEFMHRLPPNMEGHGPPPLPPPPFVVNPNINGGAKAPRFHIRDDRSPSRFGDSGDDFKVRQSSQEDEFPALGSMPDDRDRGRFDDRPTMSRQGSQNIDPSRSRFATAVKKPLPAGGSAPIVVSGAKFVVSPAPGEDTAFSSSPPSVSMIVPKASPRIKLRPPTLLPTLPTGDALNKLYMTYRERPLQLQAARNACLARAADAWRRNDGASAKRFSRDANELNAKMGSEAKDAAGRLIAERARILMGEVQATSRGGGGAGKAVGGGLGVVLGVAGVDAGGATRDNDEMRTEVAIDLHGLHAAEGVDYLDEFMLSLERERFLGLAYVIVGEEKHTGTQDSARGASKLRLAAAIKESLYHSGYAWNEWKGILCVDVQTHY